MDFWKAILSLARRRYVGPPILGVAILLAALAYLITPPHYMSSTTMVLTIPTSGGTLSQDPSKPTGLTNPLLNFGDGLKTTSAILIQSMNTPEVADELGVGDATKLTVNDGSGNPGLLGVSGPFVYIEADAASAEEARGVVFAAQERVRRELLNRQKALNAPPVTYITMSDVVPASTPEVMRDTQIQLAAAALVLIVIGGLVGAYAAERLRAGRRRKDPTGAEPAGPTPDTTDSAAVDPATVRFSPVGRPNGKPVPANGSDVPVPQQVRTPR
jgi:hypothetical protein